MTWAYRRVRSSETCRVVVPGVSVTILASNAIPRSLFTSNGTSTMALWEMRCGLMTFNTTSYTDLANSRPKARISTVQLNNHSIVGTGCPQYGVDITAAVCQLACGLNREV